MRLHWIFLVLLVGGFTTPQNSFAEVCPGVGIQARTPDFTPGGIVLTSFDNSSMWVYNISSDARYPLPDTRPCGINCRLSPDARWITFVNPLNYTYGKMRLDGTERTLITEYATDVEWWSADRLLVWTPGHHAYLQPEGGTEREYLNVNSVVSVQPGGKWGLQVQQAEDAFSYSLLNLETRDFEGIAEQSISLAAKVPYLNGAAWSPDGAQLVYVAPGQFDDRVEITGGELFSIRPGDAAPIQITDLHSVYGAVRINGTANTELSWSPDSAHIAFWAIELMGPDPEHNTGRATLHVYSVATGELQAYCGFSTDEHTPHTPRLVWSPDSTHIAFGANIPGDEKGYLLLALNIETGVFTELSNGIYPALGKADVIAWGLPPR